MLAQTPGGLLAQSRLAFSTRVAVLSGRPSSPGELHPEALTEPCLSFSTHTALVIHEELPPFAQSVGSSCVQVIRCMPFVLNVSHDQGAVKGRSSFRKI